MNARTHCFLTAASLLLSVAAALSQDTTYYSFEVTNEPYISLMGTPVDTLDTAITNNIVFTSIPDYSIFGKAPSHTFEASATGGFLVSVSNDFAYTLDPFLCDLEKRDSGSAFIVHGAVTATDTVMIIEWVNMGLLGHPVSDFVNFQLWIYNNRDVVEMRYGASEVTGNQAFQSGYNGPAINFARRHISFTPAYDNTWLKGDPNAPERTTSNAYTALDGTPDSGTVYRFYAVEVDTMPSDTATGIAQVGTNENAWTIYPNPAAGSVNIAGTQNAVGFQWYDVRGIRLPSSGRLNHGQQEIETPSASGIYILELRSAKTVHREVITVLN